MKKVIEGHTEEFGSRPEVVVSAPGRFDLMGEHSAYFGDKTLSMAVDLSVFVAISRRTDNTLRFYYFQQNERKKIPLSISKFRKEDKLANIVKSIIYGFSVMGYSFAGFDVTFYSDYPPSVDFGIISALKTATAFAIKKLHKIRANDSFISKVIENGDKLFFNTEFYPSDVNTVLFSKKNTCVLTNNIDYSYEIIPFKFEGMSIVLTDAKVPPASLWSEDSVYTEHNKKLLASLKNKKKKHVVYEESVSEINEVLGDMSENVRRRLICIMKENQNLNEVVDSLLNLNLHNFVRAINKSHDYLRDYFTISCPEIDWLVKRVQEFDINSQLSLSSCSRITGVGFSRCTYTIVKDELVEQYMQKLQDYERIFGFHPITYIVHPSSSACVIDKLDF